MVKLMCVLLVTVLTVVAVAWSAPEDKVQLNVAEASMGSVLRMLGKAGNVDIVVPPELNDKVVKQLRLEGAPVGEALRTLLMPYGYEAAWENNAYQLRKSPTGGKPLIHVTTRLLNLLTVDLDRLVAEVPPAQLITVPGGVSIVRGQLFGSCVALLANGAAQVINEQHRNAAAGQRVSVPLSPGHFGAQELADAPDNRLMPSGTEAFVTPELTEAGAVELSVTLVARWVRVAQIERDARMTVDVPRIAVGSEDELWVRGWQRLVEPATAPAGREVVLVLKAVKQPLEE